MGYEEMPSQIERLPEEDAVGVESKQQQNDYAPSEIQKEAPAHDDPEWINKQKKYLRKLDLILMPTISILYFFEYLDRGNIANARLYGYASGHDTRNQGIGPGKQSLTDTQWQTVIIIFYVGLILCQVPGCIGYRVFPPSKWIAFGVCGWCATSLLQCVAFNRAGALVCRVFLGAFEGLFGTGIVYYLSLWYHRTEMGVRVFWFLGPTALAGAFGGLIAYGIGHLESSTPTWKWLFLIEALPGFCLGVFCLYWVPDRPMKNWRFSGVDQEIAEARFHSELFEKAGGIQKKHMFAALTDWRLYGQVAVYFPTAAMLSSISGFLPTVIRGLGYEKPTSANLMTVPPYACAFVLMYIMSRSSDHFKERGLHITALAIVAMIAYALLATLPESSLHGKYGCVCVAVACVYATYPPSHAWAANNFGNETKRAVGMGLYTAMGNFGSIAGSFFYPSRDAPQFQKGHYLCMGMAIATAVFSLSNSMALRYVNRKRDEKYGKPMKGIPVDVSELADANPHFRYIT